VKNYILTEGEIRELMGRAGEIIPEAAAFELDDSPIASHCGEKMVKFIAYQDEEKKLPVKIIHLCRNCEHYFAMKFSV